MSPAADNTRPQTPPAQRVNTSATTAGTSAATADSNGEGITRKTKPGVMPLSPKTPEKVRRIVSNPWKSHDSDKR